MSKLSLHDEGETDGALSYVLVINSLYGYSISVDLDGTVRQTSKEPPPGISSRTDLLSSKGERSNTESKNPTLRMEQDHSVHESGLRKNYVALSPPKRPLKETFEDSTRDHKVHTNRKSTPNMQTSSKPVETNSHASPESLVDALIDPAFPSEVVTSDLSNLLSIYVLALLNSEE